MDRECDNVPAAEKWCAELDHYIASFGAGWGDAHAFAGFVLVARGERALFARGFGPTSGTLVQPPGLDTSFRVGSVTKQFTAAAVLALMEEGRLQLSDHVEVHLPDFVGPAAQVTLHQLLSHTAGVPEYNDVEAFVSTRARPRSTDELLSLFMDRPLEFAPGSAFKYSNSGYVLLGAVLESAARMPYGDVLRTRLFEPAGMDRSVFGDGDGLSDRASGFEVVGNRRGDAEAFAMENAHAAGGVRSTVRDLWRWDRALRAGRILPPASRARLFAPVRAGYAYGFQIVERPGGRVARHDGGIDGFTTSFARGLDDDVLVLVWNSSQLQHAPLVAEAALAGLAGEPLKPRAERPEAPFVAAAAARHLGRYRLTASARQRLVDKGVAPTVIARLDGLHLSAAPDCLVLARPERSDVFLFADCDGGYFAKDAPYLRVAFEPLSGGGQMVLTQGAASARFERCER